MLVAITTEFLIAQKLVMMTTEEKEDYNKILSDLSISVKIDEKENN